MKSTKLSTLFLPAAAMLLVSQFVFAQQRPSIRPDKTLVAKAIAAAQTTGKAVPIVPASTIKALAAARPTIWLTNGNALAAKSKPAAKPAGQWNRSRLVVTEDRVEHWLNGVMTAQYPVDVAFDSPLLLQHHASEVRFRGIRGRRGSIRSLSRNWSINSGSTSLCTNVFL